MNNKAKIVVMIAMVFAGISAAMADPPGTLTLKAAIQMALQNSGELAASRAAADVAQRQSKVSRSPFLPSLFTGSGAAYTDGFPSSVSGAAPSIFNLNYIETLFNPPLRGQVRAAQDMSQAQRAAVEGARDKVIVQVSSNYLELDEVNHSIALLGQELQSAQKVIQVTKERVQAGLELPIDETRAELTHAQIEQNLISLQGRQDVLEQDLHIETGLPDNQPIVPTNTTLPPETKMTTGQMLTLALQHSPTLHQAQIEARARLANLKGQRGGYWPTVNLVGQYMVLSKINNYDQFFRSFQRNNLNVGVEVQIPIFQARTSAAVSLANSQYQEAELELGNQRHALEIQVKQEQHQTREQDAAKKVARLEWKLAQQNLDMVQAQFNQGHATLAAVEQAQLNESQKWVNFLEVNFQGQKAQLQLMQTTGQLALLLQ